MNNNDEVHSEGKMVRKMLEKIQVPNNGQLKACNRICSSMHRADFLEENVVKLRNLAEPQQKRKLGAGMGPATDEALDRKSFICSANYR